MGTQEYGLRNFQELLMLPREEYEAMTAEQRQEYADRLNQATDEANATMTESLFGLCPDCKARRRKAHP